MQAKALPGFRDFYPDDAALRRHIFDAWRTVAVRYGFEEYDGPPLETLDLYTAKSGAEIVEQLYAFEDKGGRAVALRPEMTPTLARMVAARAGGLKKPIRWYSMPQLFRYERQQRGRLREHFQLNMDVIGDAGPLSDVEVVAAAVDIMRALGLGPGDVRVRLSDRRVIACLLRGAGVPEAALPEAYAAIDKIERVDRSVLERQLAASVAGGAAAGELPAKVLDVGAIRGVGPLTEALARVPGGDLAGEHLLQAVRGLEAMGLGGWIDVDLSIVRGLAYYTGIVFELFDAAGSMRAICGGGRYDGLLEALGKVDLPAVGFGMGDVVLGELVRERGGPVGTAHRLDAFLVAVTGEDVEAVLEMAHALRDDGSRAEYGLRHQSVMKQLKLASARPARYAVIIGPDERRGGEATVRDLETGDERRVALADVPGAVREGLPRAGRV